MKAQKYLGIILVAAAVSAAHGAEQENQDFQSRLRQRFTEVASAVKVKISNWWSYWNGGDKTAPINPQQSQVASPAGAAQPSGAVPQQAPPPQVKTVEPVTAPAAAPVPRPADTAEQTKFKSQPVFAEKKAGSTLSDIRSVNEAVRKATLLSVVKPGLQGTSNLPKSKSGVPLMDFRQMHMARSVPRLDIGTENEISAKDFNAGNLSWSLNTGSQFERLPLVPSIYSHELSEALRIKGLPAPGPRFPQDLARAKGKAVDQASIDAIGYKLEVGEEVNPLPYRPFTEDELKMAAALILFSRGNQCHTVMGAFYQLSRLPKSKVEASYHLGACADELKLHQAAFDNLSGVISAGDPDYSAPALERLADGLPSIYEKDFYKLVKGVANFKSMITEKNRDVIVYRLAKGAYRLKEYKTAAVYADQVAGGELLADARILSAMSSFAVGEKSHALKKLEDVWKMVEDGKDSNIRALTAVNLARMYFSQGKYAKALDSYMQVPKDHPFWVQALIEQGWTQLALEDFPGAIGNMYSLHSPYFKAVYQPESFVVRSIGYLNICQYGDAYKTLTWLEKDYRDWHTRLSQYLDMKGGDPVAVYRTVKSYIQGKSSESVDGVPFQIWREMARRKEFLNLQSAMNEKLDETRRFDGVNEKIKAEKGTIRVRADQAKRRFDTLRAKIDHLKVDRTLARELPQWQNSLKLEKDLIIGLRHQLAVLEQGRQGFLEFQNKCQKKIEAEMGELTSDAGKSLVSRAKAMRDEMNRVLENNEFLRYEVFAGSGENIRYQVAGGEVNTANRVPAHIKPTKMMNWSFDGEFWEDEIGSYRSSLQNNCPNARRTGAQAQNH